MGCVEVAPTVFQYNESIGFMEVLDLDEYPLEDVEEAIKNCPVDCITWEGDGEGNCHDRYTL